MWKNTEIWLVGTSGSNVQAHVSEDKAAEKDIQGSNNDEWRRVLLEWQDWVERNYFHR